MIKMADFINPDSVYDEYKDIDFDKLNDIEKLKIGCEILEKRQIIFAKNFEDPIFSYRYNKKTGQLEKPADLEKKL